MVGANGGDAEGQGLAGDELAVVGGHLETLDLHGVGFRTVPEFPGHPPRSIGQEVAELALPKSGHPEQFLSPFGVAELEIAAHGAVVDGVGVKTKGAAGRHRVDAVFIAEVVQRADLGEVEDLKVRAEQADILVIELGFASFMVVNRNAAAHGTVGAAISGDAEVVEALAVELPGIGVMGLAEVPDGEAGHLIAKREDSGRALDGPAAFFIDLADLLQVAVAQRFHTLGIGLGDGPAAFDYDGFEQLRAHDSAHARPAAGPPFQAADDGIVVEILAALADVQDADPLAVLSVDPVVGGVCAFSPNLISRQELDLVVLYIEHRRTVGLSLDDQGIVAGFPELFGHSRSQVAVAIEARQRRFSRDDRFPCVGGRDAGNRPEGDDKLVIRAQGIGAGLDLVIQDFYGEAPSAHPFLGEFLTIRFFFSAFRGQVDPEKVAGPAVHPMTSMRAKIYSMTAYYPIP